MKSVKKKTETFEEGLAKLEDIVSTLEDQGTGLDRALIAFEEGLILSRSLRKRLDEAAGKIEILSKDLAGHPVTAPFDLDDDYESADDDL